MGRSMCAALTSGGFSGAGLLKSPSKCSAHLVHFPGIAISGLLSLSLTSPSGLPYFPAGFFVVSYSVRILPSVAAFFPTIPRSCSA
ncbi:unnamed protein product [Schistosoma mattheei]|uniref:Uncharacterized protein n=1 Tax=Schistosoma mattheei TaxID=31246 RepID=A0A183PZR4_9TREM|nr:unnamed protein product [Schistosoma mattheei]